MIVPHQFYLDLDVNEIARSLLGKLLISTVDEQYTSGIIVETEAYKAPDDKASHAYLDKKTARTDTMFKVGGCAYVYLCYGIHEMFNIVSAPEGIAHAILVRALEPQEGIQYMHQRLKREPNNKELCNGPGKLSKALGINRKMNQIKLYREESHLQIHDIGYNHFVVKESERVGISYAKECAHWPWRYRIKDNPFTSKPSEVNYSND